MMVISEEEFYRVAEKMANSRNVKMGVISLDEALSDYFKSKKVQIQDEKGYIKIVKFKY